MLATCDVVAFVATAKPDAARVFYRDVLGLPLRGDDPFALVFDAHGIMLRVTKAQAVTTAPHTVLGWRVADVRAAVAALAAKGVATERFPGLPQDEAGIWTRPTGHGSRGSATPTATCSR